MNVAETARLAGDIFAASRAGIRYRQILRTYICPFQILMSHVPPGGSVLDIGCGPGLFILMLARLGRIRSAVGFDADGAAIRAAQEIASSLPSSAQVRFEHRNASDAWPEGRFDAVCLIDVMHHVRPGEQARLIATAAQRVAAGGVLIYKDIGSRPWWRGWANRAHDLLSAREWIYYAELDGIVARAQGEGLHLESMAAIDMLWYRNELCVFRRPAAGTSENGRRHDDRSADAAGQAGPGPHPGA